MLSVCRVLLLFVCVFCLVRCDVAAANKRDVQSVVSQVKEQLQQAQQLGQKATDEHKSVLTGANDVLSLLKKALRAARGENTAEVIGKLGQAEQKAQMIKTAVETTKTAVEAAKGTVEGLAGAAAKEAGGAGGVVTTADMALRLWGNVTAQMESQLAAVNDVIGNITGARGKFEEKQKAESQQQPEQSPGPSPPRESTRSQAGLTGQPGERGEPAPPSPSPSGGAGGPGPLPPPAQRGDASGQVGKEAEKPKPQSVTADTASQKALTETDLSEGQEEGQEEEVLPKILKPVSLAKTSLLSPPPTTTKFNVLQQNALSGSGDDSGGAASTDNNEAANKALQSAIESATTLSATVHATNNVMLAAAEASAKAVEAAEKWAAALMSGGEKSTRGGGDAASLLSSSSLFFSGSIPGVAFCFALYHLSVCIVCGGILF